MSQFEKLDGLLLKNKNDTEFIKYEDLERLEENLNNLLGKEVKVNIVYQKSFTRNRLGEKKENNEYIYNGKLESIYNYMNKRINLFIGEGRNSYSLPLNSLHNKVKSLSY